MGLVLRKGEGYADFEVVDRLLQVGVLKIKSLHFLSGVLDTLPLLAKYHKKIVTKYF